MLDQQAHPAFSLRRDTLVPALEIEEGARGASRGLAGIAAAFGIAVIAASAATLVIAMLLGDVTGRLWLGALMVGVIEILAGGFFYRRGRVTLSGEGEGSLAERGRLIHHRQARRST